MFSSTFPDCLEISFFILRPGNLLILFVFLFVVLLFSLTMTVGICVDVKLFPRNFLQKEFLFFLMFLFFQPRISFKQEDFKACKIEVPYNICQSVFGIVLRQYSSFDRFLSFSLFLFAKPIPPHQWLSFFLSLSLLFVLVFVFGIPHSISIENN